mgnify:CR=1 FL=1
MSDGSHDMQSDAAQGDAAQSDAAQGDAAQGDAAQSDAAQRVAPKISVLVPVYRFEVGPLATSLARMARDLDGAIEVRLLDDGTPDAGLRLENRAAIESADRSISYSELEQNVGRARARNHLAEGAQGDFLLFLDADVLPDGSDFFERYLRWIEADAGDVACGGLSYEQRIRRGREYRFHLALARSTELLRPEEKSVEPWRHLTTANLLVRRSLFASIPFDPEFSGYGYEDSEWGIRVSRCARVSFIENSVSHLGLIEERELVARTARSLPNFRRLADLHPAEFSRLPIARLVRPLRRVPAPLLATADYLLGTTTRLCPVSRAKVLSFQLKKAVGLAREFRRSEKPRSLGSSSGSTGPTPHSSGESKVTTPGRSTGDRPKPNGARGTPS